MSNINNISDSYLCSNCGACDAICPHNAIDFKATVIGRHYAHANDNCIDCSLCVKVCPSSTNSDGVKNEDSYVGHVETVYTGRCADKTIFQNGQSGGMTTAILKHLFEESMIDAAVVTVMLEGATPHVEGRIITTVDELNGSQKSCYTPVEILSVLKDVNNFKKMALVGLPCHIEGLRKLQETSKRFSNVKYAIGLICDRTLCEGIQDVISSFCDEPSLKIDWRRKDYLFKGKYYPYSAAPVVVFNSNGFTKVFPKYYRIALKDFFTSPRCRVCHDKLNISADVVLGDPWGMKGVDLKHGQSLILTRTKEGESIVRNMVEKEKAVLSVRTLAEVIKGQHIEDRRKQVETFSTALQMISTEFEKPNKGTLRAFPNEKVKEAYFVLGNFIETEQKEKAEILHLSREIIRKAGFLNYYKNNYIVKIINRFKSLIKKTKK